MQKIIQKLREIIPLSLRTRIGPYVAYVVYIINVYILVNRKRPKVLSLDQTLDKVKSMELSVIRFGDGEMSLINNHDLAFQKSDPELAKKMTKVLQARHDKLLICIPGIWEKIHGFSKRSFWFTLHHLFKYGSAWKKILSSDYVYGDAFITRPYLNYKKTPASERIFNKMISLWEHKDVVLIEGSQSRLGIGNDLFANTKSLQRILCPSENAFSKYSEIKNVAMKTPNDKLVLLSLGPTAKILAYDLFLAGYRVLDIGHIDMEYEMYLRKKPGIVKVKYKYFNEIEERNPDDCTDPAYLSQIVARID
ncbi:MAG: SP_1767 family glycosyltransferase [bacterium]